MQTFISDSCVSLSFVPFVGFPFLFSSSSSSGLVGQAFSIGTSFRWGGALGERRAGGEKTSSSPQATGLVAVIDADGSAVPLTESLGNHWVTSRRTSFESVG
jgi:hypothetical protein